MEEFVLRKMNVRNGSPVQYFWDKKNAEESSVNALIGKEVALRFRGKIICEGCGKVTRKSFSQGYCYPCYQTHPAAEECILRPELCKAHLGVARDMQWAQIHHLAPHYVYLAFASNLKVGVTRNTQIPTRWIDQGAMQAMACLEVPNRHIAGVVEVFLKQFYSDKSAWQKMLQTQSVGWDIDLKQEKETLLSRLPTQLKQYALPGGEVQTFTYPSGTMGPKLQSLNLDKHPDVEGKLTGIKGQYLIFDHTRVLNVRKHTGYEISLEIKS